MKKLGEIIYTSDVSEGPAAGKRESHVPKIEVKKEEDYYKIKVWVGPHPNTVEHSIRWIEVFFYEEGRQFNPISLGRFEFEPGLVEPFAKLKVKLEKKGIIYALSYCNIHGLWENRVPLE
ncbi:class II SORL domain-containing protein [Thermococcus argininiproducens]|uniref:Class II SORL domain-containing protein n=1 Tax=Thermococcus argininiproducens TaxID=2866384 RepID=A0A9E7SD88_9EURY|nr:class II SORL domain-containing protein [Thermococcus argininiproducens]USH00312.1 class II SORL domain-containing protein [Thermococcus argininiproducens]